MTWGMIGGAAIGAVGSYASAKSGEAPGFGGGMDYANKAARQPMLDTLKDLQGIYGADAINPLMQQGFDTGSMLPQTLQPYMNFGNQMIGMAGGAAGQMGQNAYQLSNYDPTQYNQQYQGGSAYGPQYDQNTFNQMMGNAGGVINPMLQSIAAMNQRTLGEQQMPGMAANAIGSGNTSGSKWGTNNAVLQRGMMDANANAASGLWSQMGQQAAGMGGQYGINAADQANQMARLNTTLGNQLNFQQAGQNAAQRLSGLQSGTAAYGNLLEQANPYWGAMMQTQTALPELYTRLGMQQRNAPADWLKMKQDAIGVVGNFGTGGAAGAGGGTPVDYMKGISQGAEAGISLADYWGNSGGGVSQDTWNEFGGGSGNIDNILSGY